MNLIKLSSLVGEPSHPELGFAFNTSSSEPRVPASRSSSGASFATLTRSQDFPQFGLSTSPVVESPTACRPPRQRKSPLDGVVETGRVVQSSLCWHANKWALDYPQPFLHGRIKIANPQRSCKTITIILGSLLGRKKHEQIQPSGSRCHTRSARNRNQSDNNQRISLSRSTTGSVLFRFPHPVSAEPADGFHEARSGLSFEPYEHCV